MPYSDIPDDVLDDPDKSLGLERQYNVSHSENIGRTRQDGKRYYKSIRRVSSEERFLIRIWVFNEKWILRTHSRISRVIR